jgi:DNA-binding response OmpR family regulator
MLEAMQAGADDYLVKPFDQLELKGRLLVSKRIVGLHEERRSVVALRDRVNARALSTHTIAGKGSKRLFCWEG